MRKFLFFLILLFACKTSFAQSPTLQQKLYYSCKVWGFVKYYHSNVSVCNVDWDSVLIHTLPLVKNAVTNDDFNDALDTMLAAAGPMAIANTPLPDTIPAKLKYNRNWGWTDDAVFRMDVRTILDTIKNNFRPHPECWVGINQNLVNGYLAFPYDDPMLDVNTYANYPDEYHRLLLFYKYWNIINYFNPYNYVLDKPADTILNKNVVAFDTVLNAYGLYLCIKKVASVLDDNHVEGFTRSSVFYNQATYVPKVRLRYIENKYVVVKSDVAGIDVGDVIVSVNGETTAQIEDSLAAYISAGNRAGLRHYICDYSLLQGAALSHVGIVYADLNGNVHDTVLTRTTYFLDPWFPEFYYPADSLNTVNWTTMNCGIGYINVTNLSADGADSAYSVLQNAPAIIIDIRNHPHNDGALELTNLMFASPQITAKYTDPDVQYPGTYRWTYDDALGMANNPTPYNGQVIVLFNEQTLSAGETFCMAFGQMPHAIKVGSQTAGADGVITYLNISDEIKSGFTSLGWFYPNGDSVQRIGIVPDIHVEPTVAGVVAGRDEVLDKALEAGCQIAAVPVVNNKPEITVYPNPANDVVSVRAKNIDADGATIEISDITNRVLIRKTVSGSSFLNTICINDLSPGMYILNVIVNGQKNSFKIIKI